jgi:serine/threonine-protein kinase HipA
MLTLLIAAGPNCVGDVFLNISNKFENIEPSTKEDYNKTSFWKLFEDSINSKNYEDKLSDISLAGVYPKISTVTISFPVNFINKRSQYILKLEPKEFPCLVANEFFFMSLAENCDIEVPKVKIILDKNNEAGLLVERFDRKYIKSEKRIKRIHQEDVCQLLNIYPSEKYRRSFRDIADQIEKTCSSPIIEITKLIRIYLYSYFIVNGDLHAKNISVLEDRKTRRVFLSPAYDLLSTLPYGDTEMALEIEGKKNNIRYKDIINFAKRYKIVPKALDQIIDVLKNQIILSTDKLTDIGLTDKKTAFLIKTIKLRTEKF